MICAKILKFKITFKANFDHSQIKMWMFILPNYKISFTEDYTGITQSTGVRGRISAIRDSPATNEQPGPHCENMMCNDK
jgi:hypothetical protein